MSAKRENENGFIVSEERMQEMVNGILRDFRRVPDGTYSVGLYLNPTHVRTMVNAWAENKAPLIKAMRKHPDWDENSLAIRGRAKSQSTNEFSGAMKLLNRMIFEGYINPRKNFVLWSRILDCATRRLMKETLTPDDAVVLNRLFDDHGASTKLRAGGGQRTGRVLRKILVEFGFDEKNKKANRLFHRVSEEMSPAQNTVPFILSVHPMDFVRMSYGNSWQSCHTPGGMFGAGGVSYMADSVTTVGYVVREADAKSGSELWKFQKIARELFMFAPTGEIMQSRLYPQTQSSRRNYMKDYLDTVVDMWYTVLDAEVMPDGVTKVHPNLDIAGKAYRDITNNERVNSLFIQERTGLYYPDWSHGYPYSIARLTGVNANGRRHFSYGKTIGHRFMCMSCGTREMRGASTMVCDMESCYRDIRSSKPLPEGVQENPVPA